MLLLATKMTFTASLSLNFCVSATVTVNTDLFSRSHHIRPNFLDKVKYTAERVSIFVIINKKKQQASTLKL